MTSIRSRGAAASLAALIVALALAGCGGSNSASTTANSAGADAGDGSGDGNGNGNGNASSGPAVTPGGGQGGSEDAEEVGAALVPPNATEISKTLTGNYWYASYLSTDSPDSLKSYYEDKIPSLGLMVISTTTAGGAHSWLVATDESGSFGGSVTVGPPTEGDAGSTVIVGIGSN
jgi:hypothetical protein